MTPALQLWHRRPSRVHALELTHSSDLACAELWLRAHHADVVRCHPALADAIKFRQWPSRLWLTATLGQRLTRDVRTGAFAVVDEPLFLVDHNQPDQTTEQDGASA